MISDAQVHIWAANTPERPWTEGRKPHRPVPFTKDDLLREMDAAGVQRAVLVPPSLEGDRNDLVLAAAQSHPDRFAAMGLFDVNAPGARGRIAGWRSQPGMLGLRLSFNRGDPPDDSLWAEAELARVPIMLSVANSHLPIVDKAAARHPGLKLVVDHLALPMHTKDEAAFAGLDDVLALAKHANIAVKATCLPSYTADSYPFRKLHPYIRRVYDAFGRKRIFWGTDFTRLACPYRQAVTMFTEEIPWLTAEDKEWIMGRGLCEWIGWKLP